MGLIENDEIIWKEIATLPFLLFDRRAQEHEEQSVINDNHIRREEAFARLLEETIRGLAARLGGADVRLTANLRPDFRIGLDGKVAERSILRGPRPIGDPRQFGRLRGGEQLAGLLQRALETARTEIILPPFHERSLELDRENLPQDGDVLVKELFLQIDRVRRDHRFLFLLDREENGGREISDRFADASPGLDHQMSLFFQSPGHRHRHLLLLRPVLEVLRLRERSIFRKERPDLFDKVTAKRVSKGDHDEELRHRKLSRARDLFSELPICNLRFVYKAVEALCGSGNLDRKSKFHIPKLLMRLLDRYVLRYFLLAYFYCIAGFISIWFIFDISDNLSTFLDERISRSLIAKYYLTQAPQILVILLPVALLLALLFCLGRMSRSNEIVSMLTAGVSLPRARRTAPPGGSAHDCGEHGC